MRDCGGWVYVMANRPRGVPYIGVTSDLIARVTQHRTGQGSQFCKRYNLTRLVLVERFPSMAEAILREKRLKEWQRSWKIRLIEESNPSWRDLYDDILM